MTFASDFIVNLVEHKYPDQTNTIVDIIGIRLDSLTSSILGMEKLAREAMTDLLKFAFNVLLHYPKVRLHPHSYQEQRDYRCICDRLSTIPDLMLERGRRKQTKVER